MLKHTCDLIIENSNVSFSSHVHSPTHVEKTIYGYRVIESFVKNSSYNTIVSGRLSHASRSDTKRLSDTVYKIVSEYIGKLKLPREKRILFCGIGNSDLTADSLGPAIFKKVITTADCDTLPSIFASCPGVSAKTGIETADIILNTARLVRADLIVTADSLSAKFRDRLCGVIQITDIGMMPGSAFVHTSKEINSSTMPCPVISVGVPTVIRSDILCDDENCNEILFVSPADCDREIEIFSSVIAGGLNRAFLGNDL